MFGLMLSLVVTASAAETTVPSAVAAVGTASAAPPLAAQDTYGTKLAFAQQTLKVSDTYRISEVRRRTTTGHSFADKAALQTAVDLWVSDEASARLTYGDISTGTSSR